MASVFKTNLFIPSHKQSVFILIFEETLINSYNVIPIFGPTTKKNMCEIKFMYKTANIVGPSSMSLDTKMAKRMVRENLHILKEENGGKNKRLSNSVKRVIDLDGENSSTNSKLVKMVDLTKSEPEIIILDDSVHQKSSASVIDLDCSSVQSEVQVLSVSPKRRSRSGNNISISSSLSDSEIKVLQSTFKSKPKRFASDSSRDSSVVVLDSPRSRPTKRAKRSGTPAQSKPIVPLVSPIRVTISPTGSKREIHNIGKTRSPLLSIPTPATRSKTLSDGVLKYYKDIAGILDKRRKKSPLKRPLSCNRQRENKNRVRSRSPLKKLSRKAQPQGVIKQNEVRHRSPKSPVSHINPRQRSRDQKSNAGGESNIFNPNPLFIDMEGLRPIVIDGSNVAIQHGKGKFSVKGVKICIDYFATRGHRDVKVFLPQSREEFFSEELLKELREKCDIVFTPSRCINGIWKTSYDDRFIVQYAVEFGGVIVSTDNYRDLLKENQRWRKTIHERLLMFTWVDDFLMFPVDPLGRSGPTLEQFLRF